MKQFVFASVVVMSLLLIACGEDDDDNGNEADMAGVGAQCMVDDDCQQPDTDEMDDSDTVPMQVCLQQFKGGYCGIEDCLVNEDCPVGSACVAHTDGTSYCFRACVDKVECNVNRDADVESNCSGNIDFVEPETPGKACVPPSN